FLGEEVIKLVLEFQMRQPKVLEIGTGAGYMAILAVLNGASHATVEELEILERALMDSFYKSLDQYLKSANQYLNPDGGRLFIGFSITAGYKQISDDIAKNDN
ncbi:unnamed protein product, partial [Didymodactylos carnosus]